MRVRALLLAALAALVLGVPGAPASQPRPVVGEGVSAAAERTGSARVVVALRVAGATGSGDVRAARSAFLARNLRGSGFRLAAAWATAPALAGTVTPAGLERLRDDPAVLRVDLDRGGRAADAESLALVRAAAAHAAGLRGAGVTVAVLDTGIDGRHPDLADAVVGEHCVVPSGCPNGAPEQDGPGSGLDDHGHGTNVAGIVAANGSVAPVGVAPDASLVAVKVLDREGIFETTSQIVTALDWIATSRPDVRVVNMSLGTFQRFVGTCDAANAATLALASTIAALRSRGVVVVASSLNDASTTTMSAPACLSGVISVGAVYDAAVGVFQFPGVCTDQVTARDQVACFSNASPELDLLAPGALITSAGAGGGLSTFAGTSQAAPHAAGAAALLLQKDSTLTPDAVESALETTGVRITDRRTGRAFPRLDVAGALQLQPPAPPPPAPPRLALARRTLAFGGVRVGARRTLELSLANLGESPLVVTASAQRPFSLARARTVRLPPGTGAVLLVAFRPGAVRPYAGDLRLVTNDPARPRASVRLRGAGTRR